METTSELNGRVVLVTGAGRGIGRSIASSAARAGASVLAGSRTVSDLESLAEEVALEAGFCQPFELDVTSMDSIDAFVASAVDRFGRIDGLVNNAGAGLTFPSLEFSEEDFDHAFDLNVKSTFFCSQRAARVMVSDGNGGSIVNISSIFGSAGIAGRAAYCGAKAAVDNLTRSFAVEWARAGIRVNAVAPGVVNTPGYVRAKTHAPAMVSGMLANIPSGKIVEPEDIAAMVLFLLSDACAALTGQIINVDGGQSASLLSSVGSNADETSN